LKTDYYAIIDTQNASREPSGVLRRISHDSGERDEVFTRNLMWEKSWSLYSTERGDTENEFVPIGEEEAMRIVERIRREVAGQ
jgi:hypothetical protein